MVTVFYSAIQVPFHLIIYMNIHIMQNWSYIFEQQKIATRLKFEVFSLEQLWTLNQVFGFPPPSPRDRFKSDSLALEKPTHMILAS